MQITHATAKDVETVLTLTTITIAVFWRTVLRLTVAIIVAIVLVLIGLGVFVLLQSMHN
jgi:hypothetical protein